jgi:hypothetical protein
MYQEELRLLTVFDLDCRLDLVYLFCHVRESCDAATWSNPELYIVPPTLAGRVTGRVLASLCCQLEGGDGILYRVCLSGPERLVHFMCGCLGHLLRSGWPLVARETRARKADL